MNEKFHTPGNLANRLVKFIQQRKWEIERWRNDRRVASMTRQVITYIAPDETKQAVVLFNASTGILDLSLNSAFQMLAAWGLQLQNVPIVHFVCQSGMSRCVQGTNRDNHKAPPPCSTCVAHSRRQYRHADIHWFTYAPDTALASALQGLNLEALIAFEWKLPESIGSCESIPLGALAIPSLRWILRRHHLPDDEPTRFLLREYILSAYRVAQEFSALLDRVNPHAVIVFNGMVFPEAMARWVTQARGLRAITHEVGLRTCSAFFTDGEATIYPIDIPEDFELNPKQNARLDAYLEQRFQGNFTMAGIRFWPEMYGLDEEFLQRAAQFKQIVPIFTNVVFDTSQAHANIVFPNMFTWLDLMLEIMREHPETLFVIRAHPDEMRLHKESRESVEGWVTNNQVYALPNVLFIEPKAYISSYELIQRSKFVSVYNSSIGLEATLMGKPVLCGGKARYTQYPMVFFPQTPESHLEKALSLLQAENIEVPPIFQRNARRFLYYQLFRTSLPFDAYLEDTSRPGFVKLRSFPVQDLQTEHSPTMRAIVRGVLDGAPFLLDDELSS